MVPFTKPDAAGRRCDAATVGDQAGTIRVTWPPPADNGRPITKYVVTAGGKPHRGHRHRAPTLDGFGDGENVTVEVRAVNEAGDGRGGHRHRAGRSPTPTVTVTGASPTVNTGDGDVQRATHGGGTRHVHGSRVNGGGTASRRLHQPAR